MPFLAQKHMKTAENRLVLGLFSLFFLFIQSCSAPPVLDELNTFENNRWHMDSTITVEWLFGVKAAAQFGRLTVTVTGIFSQQKSESNSVTTQGGAQVTEFEVKADDYEENRHFFLAQYFRDNYDAWLSDLPLVKSPVNITKVEVWKTNQTGDNDGGQRSVVAFMDLGETGANVFNQTLIGPGSGNQQLPNNNANDLYQQMTSTYAGARDINNTH